MSSLPRLIRMCLSWIIGVVVIGVVVPLGAMYLLLAMVGLAPTPYTCITETHGKISDLSGLDFEISETDCSTLAKDASISVFASKPGRTKKTLLFKYSPAGVGPMPIITSVGQHAIKISVPHISSLIFRREDWEGLSVNYNIGIIDYP